MEGIINGILDVVAGIGNGLVALLPASPFAVIENALDDDILGYINYFLPIEEALSVGTAWVLAIGVWYLYSLVLRWVKAIE